MKQTLIYDLASTPNSLGMDINVVMKCYMEHNIVFYNSQESGVGSKTDKPQVLNIPEGSDIKIVDLSEEGLEPLKTLES